MRRLPLAVTLLALALPAVACSESSNPDLSYGSDPGAIPDNAATAYLDIHSRIDDNFLQIIHDHRQDLRVTSEVERAFEDNEDILAELLAATKAKQCDFAIDYSEGFNTLLPHVSTTRQLAIALTLDAKRHAQQGDARAAAEQLAGVVRMASHIGEGQTQIEKLVGYAVLSLALGTATDLADQQLISNSEMRPVLGALGAINLNDPFDAREAVDAEQRALLLALRDPSTAAEHAQLLSRFSEADRRTAMSQAESLFATIKSAWTQPDAQQRIERAINAVRSPILKPFLPALDKFWETKEKVRDEIRTFQTRYAS